MRILIAHNQYRESGGEDVVADAEMSLLGAHGHDVRLALVSNAQLGGALESLQVAIRAPYSTPSYEKFSDKIREFRPDVVHVHNFFPIYTPSIYDACADHGVPVVQSLHNYRLLCPQGLMFRNGKPCQICMTQSPYNAVLHACYRKSRAASAVAARMVAVNRHRRTWHRKVSRFIALTESSKQQFVRGGLPDELIVVKPNFAPDPGAEAAVHTEPGAYAVFIGRLSAEKGVGTLLRAWKRIELPLHIVGTGPLEPEVRAASGATILPRGFLDRRAITDEVRNAAFLVMPTEWYEPFGLVVVEAFSYGIPAIASRIGAMAEIIEDGVTGLHFTPGDAEELAAKVAWAAAHPEEMRVMGQNARRAYERHYTPETNYRRLIEIYQDLVEPREKLTMATS